MEAHTRSRLERESRSAARTRRGGCARHGRIPGVVYGARKEGEAPEGMPVAVDPKALLHDPALGVGRQHADQPEARWRESRVMVKEYQLDPVTHQLLHADFYQLAMDQAITVTVPVLITASRRASSSRAACSTSSRARSRCSACRPTSRSTSTSTSAS